MIIGKGDKVKYVARIGLGEDAFVHGEGYVIDVGDGVLEVADEATGVCYSVWDCDAELIIGGRKKEAEHHDKHYAELKVQPMDVIAEWTVEQQIGFLRGNILKYVMRLGHKDKALQEARKVLRYAEWLVQVLEGKTINPRE